MDRLREMEVFVEIAAAGSLAAAGRRLHMSPPAVTRMLSGLEARLGVTLLQRSTRSLRLTDAGARFLAAATRTLEAAAAAEVAAVGAGGPPRGRVTASASVMFGRLAVAPMVREFLESAPEVQVALTFSDRVVSLVEEGFDLSIRIGRLPDSRLRARRVGTVRRVLVASPDYLARRGTPTQPADLTEHEVIFFTGIRQTQALSVGGSSVALPPPQLELNDAAAALDAARAGFGILPILSYISDADVAAGRMVELLPAFSGEPRPVSVIFPELPGPAARALIDHLSAGLGRYCGIGP